MTSLVLRGSDHGDKARADVVRVAPGVAAVLTPGEGPSCNPKYQPNEDSLAVVLVGDAIVGIVADSHWGAWMGEELTAVLAQVFATAPLPDEPAALALVVARAEETILAHRPMGDDAATTLLVALVRGRRLLWASVADSHLYVIAGGAAQRLNLDGDHFAGDPPSLLDADPEVTIETGECLLPAGATVLLASDGIAEEMSGMDARGIARLLAGEAPVEVRLDALCSRACSARHGGGRDNLALVAITVGDGA